MARVKVFDTNAMIAVSQGVLQVQPDTHVVISVISRIELLAWPGLSAESLIQVREMLATVEVAPISGPIEDTVIELRFGRLLKLPDAIVAATALTMGVPLVSADANFQRVPGLLVESF